MLVPLTLMTPVPALIKNKSPPPVAILLTFKPMFPPASSISVNAPVLIVCDTGSFHVIVSSNNICVSGKLPLSILIPDWLRVIPAPASPALRTIMLSLILKFVLVTFVWAPLTTKSPVRYNWPIWLPVSIVSVPPLATFIV